MLCRPRLEGGIGLRRLSTRYAPEKITINLNIAMRLEVRIKEEGDLLDPAVGYLE